MAEPEYPKSTVWYIEARASRSAAAASSSGSAVCVWLVPPDAKSKPRKYLLTCYHCVRQYGDGTSGNHLPHVLCWPPGKGYVRLRSGDAWPSSDRDGIWTASVVDVLNRPLDRINREDFQPANDWVLLDVHEPSFQDYPSVHAWSDDPLQDVQIIGYPEGARDWNNGRIVQSLSARDFRTERIAESPAMINLTGPEETAPGMSGGGLFGGRGALVGIHRSQRVASRSTGGISAKHIASELQAYGYQLTQYRRIDSANDIKNSTTDFIGFLMNVRHLQSNLLKVILAAPLLALLMKVGPPSMDATFSSFVIIVLQFFVCVGIYTTYTASPRLRSSVLISVVASTLAIASLIFYASARGDRVVHRERNPQEGERHIEQVIVGTELKPDFAAMGDLPPAELLAEFGDAEDIYTKASIAKSKRILWWSWLALWTFGSAAVGLTLLKFGPIRPNRNTPSPSIGA